MFKRGDPKPTGQTWRHLTLQQMMKLRTSLRVWCEDCSHSASHSPVWLATVCGASYDTTLYALVQRLVCKKCGSRRVCIAVKN